MLTLDAAILHAIVMHARRDHPIEACGLVVGPEDQPRRLIPMTNAARSETYYQYDYGEFLRVMQGLEPGEVPVVFYHSHTSAGAYPSPVDIAYAAWPQAHWLLVSTETDEIRSYRIVDGSVTEESICASGRMISASVDDTIRVLTRSSLRPQEGPQWPNCRMTQP